MDQQAEKKSGRGTGLGRRTRKENSKVESNDSPEIQGGGARGGKRHQTPWPPFGDDDEKLNHLVERAEKALLYSIVETKLNSTNNQHFLDHKSGPAFTAAW